MIRLAILALILLAPAVAACAPQDRGPKDKGQVMETIVIPRTTVYNAGDHKVAVSYIVRGKYLDAAGQEHEGLKASLVVFRKGAKPGESEVRFEVGAGSEFSFGEQRYRVLDVAQDESGGAVKLERL